MNPTASFGMKVRPEMQQSEGGRENPVVGYHLEAGVLTPLLAGSMRGPPPGK